MRPTPCTLAACAAAFVVACGDGIESEPMRAAHARPARPPDVELLQRYALNAFLVPLLDDTIPARFTDVGIARLCRPGTQVRIEGRPLQPGRLAPHGVWSARWTMVGCRPFGSTGPQLDGDVGLVVYDRPGGYAGAVIPDGLMLTTAAGARYPVTERFVARPLVDTRALAP